MTPESPKIHWFLRKPKYSVITYENAFSEEEIKKIKKIAKKIGKEPGLISKVNDETKEKSYVQEESVRKSTVAWFHVSKDTQWIYQKLVDLINDSNRNNFNLNLLGIELLQYTEYDSKNLGFYRTHADHFGFNQVGMNRKLSFSIQLSDEKDYEGGTLVIELVNEEFIAPKKKGSIVFFESRERHRVEPVTSGKRISLVGWVIGPEFS